MHSRPFALAAIDQKLLLTFATLHLAADVRVEVPRVGQVLVRHATNRRPLVLSPLHWGVLKQFEGGRTSASVLKQLIHGRSCVPLGDFYELIVKAHRHGLLRDTAAPAAHPIPACPWRVPVEGAWVRRGAVACMMALVLALVIHPPAAPSHWIWWLPGWLLAGAATGAGFALAACVLHGADLEVRSPRWVLRSALPRFEADLTDVEVAPPELAINVALAQLAPFLALAALAAWFVPDLALPAVCGLLAAFVPLGAGPLFRLLRAVHHQPRLSVAHDFQFEANRTFARRLRGALAPEELRFACLRLGYAVVWSLLAALAACLATGTDTLALLRRFIELGLPARVGFALLVLLALSLLVLAGFALREFTRPLRRRLRRARARRAPPCPETARSLPDAEEIFRFLGKTHPFELVPEQDRLALAAAFRPDSCAAGELLASAGEARRGLRVLFSGRVVAPVGPRSAVRHEILPGGLFGAPPLVGDETEPHELRTAVPSVVLRLDHYAFARFVAPFVPPHVLENAIEKLALLRRLPLTRGWPPALLASFARRAVVQSFERRTHVIEAGRENTLFFLVIDGELRAFKEGRQVGRLRRGDFFGEISLLQNSLTQADVVGHQAGRFFCVSKPDFLAFLAQDTAIALQIEAIASRRLGHPVFSPPVNPLTRHRR